MKVKIKVFHVASKEVEMEIPESCDSWDKVRDFVQHSLNVELPEVHKDSSGLVSTAVLDQIIQAKRRRIRSIINIEGETNEWKR